MESNHDWADKMRDGDPAAMPPGFDWESMKEGIYSKMEKERKKPAFFWLGDLFSGKKRWISLSVITVLLSGLFFIPRFFDSPVSRSALNKVSVPAGHENSYIPYGIDNDVNSGKRITADAPAREINARSSAKSTSETNGISDLSGSSLSENALAQHTRNAKNTIRQDNGLRNHSPLQKPGYNPYRSQVADPDPPDFLTLVEKNDTMTTEPDPSSGSGISQNKIKNGPAGRSLLQEKEAIAPFAPIASKTYRLSLDDLSFKAGLKLEKGTPSSPWYAGIATGAGFGPSYTVAYDLPGRVKASEKLLCAPFVTAYIRKPLANGFYAGTGLHVQSFISRLEYNSERLMSHSVKDTVLLIERNQITGKETVHRGDTTASLLTRRRLKHVNTTSAISIPVIAGWQIQKGYWSYGVEAGMNIGLYAVQQGKAYDEKADIYTMNRGQGPYTKSLGLSFSGSLTAGYALTQKLKLRASAGYSQYLTPWRRDPAARSLKPKIVNIGMGIEYNLSK